MKVTKISLFVVASLLFLGSNVLASIGINENSFQAFIMFLSFCSAYHLINQWKKRVALVLLLLFVVMASVLKLYIDRGEGTRSIVMSFLAAPIVMASIPVFSNQTVYKYHSFWTKSLKIILYSFLVEIGIVYFERITGKMVFGWASLKSGIDMIKSVGVEEFRSTGMYGHPLYNALMVSTAMAFVLVSSLKPKYKFLLWGMGYGAILCFNTRGSIVGNALLLAVYVLNTILINRKMKDSTKTGILAAGSLAAGVAFFLLSSGLVGGRLMSMGLVDDSSAQVRLDIIEFVSSIHLQDYLFGMNFQDYNKLLFSNGMSATENWWVDYLFRCGLVFLICYMLFYTLYLKEEFRYYRLFDKLYVTIAFLFIATTNNSLSTSFVALFYYLFLIRLFNPPTFQTIVRKKYLM